MAQLIVPKVFHVAETRALRKGLQEFLDTIGVPVWKTDALSDSEMLVEVAGKLCYMSFSTELNKNLTRAGTRDNEQYIQESIVVQKHGSVLEHVSASFILYNVSRVLTHELVRHRVGTAYSQVSGRYVRTDSINMFFPTILSKYDDMKGLWLRALDSMEGWIREMEEMTAISEMKDFNLKKKLTSAFRRLIGNGQANHIFFTANHRALRHIIQLRTHESAEEEIRLVFGLVFSQLQTAYPAIYKDATVTFIDDIPKVVFASEKV